MPTADERLGLLQGTLDMLILKTLLFGPAHGHGIATYIRQTTGDTLVINVSEDAWQGDAQFAVTIDGTQVGGTFTATASHAAKQSQAITLSTSLGAGPHEVALNYINDAYGGSASADRNWAPSASGSSR